jgi:hypothetical protein
MTHHERLDPPVNVDPQFIASEQIDFDDTHQLDMSTVGNDHLIGTNVDQIDRSAPVMSTDQPGRSSSLSSPQNSGGFAATLLSNAVLFINFAIILTVSLYCLWDFRPHYLEGGISGSIPPWPFIPHWWINWRSILAPIGGSLVALIAACLYALFHSKHTTPDRVDPNVYGELRDRLDRIESLLPILCPATGSAICEHSSKVSCQASCSEAWNRWDFIKSDLGSYGSRWVLGTGYVGLYRQLHAIESALFLVQPASDVVASGLYDSLRLKGAQDLPNWEALQTRLLWALPLVGSSCLPLLTLPPVDVTAADTSASPPTPADQALGRAVLRDIRQTISEFRDGERENLVRARNQLAWTGTITIIAGYMLMALAMLRAVPPEIVSTGVVYYVVGATVGLFNQLRTDTSPETGKEDFGFRRARLFYTPVLSGLAAVFGVLVVALLYDAVDFGATADTDISLDAIFDVRQFSLGLVIAAVFGLVPDLLVDRLQQKADEYRSGLSSTSATSDGTTSRV